MKFVEQMLEKLLQ